MLRMIRGVLTICICLLGMGIPVWSSTYPTATVTIGGTQSIAPASGTMTIAFNGYSETVPYGQFSTASSIAADFAALFSVGKPGVHPCMQGVCAKATGSTITFQLNGAITFGPISFSNSGPDPFTGAATSISLTPVNSPTGYGQAVTFVANVSLISAQAGSAGTVTFYDGATVIGSSQASGASNTIIVPLTVSNLSAGQHAITAILTNPGLPNVVSETVDLQVLKASPVITWPTPAAINYGTKLSASQLDATANVPGTFAYTPASGTVIGSGNQTLFVVFTPTDAADYNTASSTTTLVVDGIQASGLPGTIHTVAGNGTQGNLGDTGLATAAQLEGPGPIATDAANNVYFCDGYYRVRKVFAVTGVITTVAGTGTGGFSGNGGPATDAEIYCAALAVDAVGDVYIANNWLGISHISKVSAATGIINTIAGNGTTGYSGDGGPATDAAIELSTIPTANYPLTEPTLMQVDAVGNVYFYNYGDGGIEGQSDMRFVSASTGIISTYLGGLLEVGSFSTPSSFTVDASGNIYFFSYEISEVSSGPGNPRSIIAGIFLQPGDTGDGGTAIDAKVNASQGMIDASGNLYFAQVGTNDIREVNKTTGIISVVASRGGPGEGCLQQIDSIGDGCLSIDAPPNSYTGYLAVDNDGNIYATDALYVRVITPPPPTQVDSATISVGCSEISYGTDAVCDAGVNAGATGTISFAYPGTGSNVVAYTPALSMVSGGASETLPTSTLPVGNYSIVATYNGDSTYIPLIAAFSLTISKATPVLTWTTPTSIPYGTPLSPQQLNASTPVPGIFTYTPGFDTVLPVGSNTLNASFVPTDDTDYTSPITMSRTLVVTQATPAVSWLPPAPIQYGTQLSSSQLNATANVPGTFAYTDSAGNPISTGTVLPIGFQTLSVTFFPTSSSNNTGNAPVTASVPIDVTADIPNISSILPNPAAVGVTVTIVGQNFGPSQGTSTLTFNGVLATATSWTDNSIVTIVPAGATTGNVVVNVSSASSNNFLLMVPKSCP